MTESVWGHYQLAWYHALAGDRAAAVDHLKRYLDFRDGGIRNLTNLDFVALRGDPGFEAIVEQIETARRRAMEE